MGDMIRGTSGTRVRGPRPRRGGPLAVSLPCLPFNASFARIACGIVFAHARPHETNVRTAHPPSAVRNGRIWCTRCARSPACAGVRRQRQCRTRAPRGLDAGALRVPACVYQLRFVPFLYPVPRAVRLGLGSPRARTETYRAGLFSSAAAGQRVDRAHSEDDVRTRPPGCHAIAGLRERVGRVQLGRQRIIHFPPATRPTS